MTDDHARKPTAHQQFLGRALGLPAFDSTGRSASDPVSQPQSHRAPSRHTQGLPERYAIRDFIATGGHGDVYLAWDHHVETHVVIKVLRSDFADSERARLDRESRTAARLNHPGVVPVFDRGRLDDGRLWFAMSHVRGKTFREILDERADEPRNLATVEQLVSWLIEVCEAIGYAHSRDLVHRDLKPNNLMVESSSGHAKVIDWGLARSIAPGAPESSSPGAEVVATPGQDILLTEDGAWVGTPAYMSPEQALGIRDAVHAQSDVYSLGVILVEALTGSRPYDAPRDELIRMLREGEAPALGAGSIDEPLLGKYFNPVCRRAIARDHTARYPDGAALSTALRLALEGARREASARADLALADVELKEAAALRETSQRLTMQARNLACQIRPYDPEAIKAPMWDLEEQAVAIRQQATLREVEWEHRLHTILAAVPDLAPAHARLAQYAQERLRDAEQCNRQNDAIRFRALLAHHDDGRHAHILRGEGTVTLRTTPSGAPVEVWRFVERHRRLQLEPFGAPLRSPLVNLRLPAGCYSLRFTAPAGGVFIYPVQIQAGTHWQHRPPGSPSEQPLMLSEADGLTPEEVLVPEGWCTVGGDPEALDGLPRDQVWLASFVARRNPVTHAEYITFLNAISSRDGRDAAAQHTPCGQATSPELVYRWRASTGFHLQGSALLPEHPVCLTDWHGASAFADWIASQSRLPWRLMHELEFEKAARGVDGRKFPWGDYFDPIWTNVANSHATPAGPCSVHLSTNDESPYGVRWLAGNTRTWCLNAWRPEGPHVAPRLRIPEDRQFPDEPEYMAVRGGSWASTAPTARIATRYANHPSSRSSLIGFRLARSL